MRQTLLNLGRKILPSPVKQTLKRVLFGLRRAKRIFFHQPNIILFYPDKPNIHTHDYVINWFCEALALKKVNHPDAPHHVSMYWRDSTFDEIDGRLQDLIKKGNVINGRCLDINKKHVDQIFSEVFGYSTVIDPLTYHGTGVEKSILNGLHDGKVIECPIKAIQKDTIYQRLIDNRSDDQFIVDYRIPILKKNIPFVYLKYKPIDDRFGLSVKASFARIDKILSQDEIKNLFLFCEKMGLDCGELDVLRDQSDGKLYVVDVNKTPTFRFVGYTQREKSWALRTYARAFDKSFLVS